MPADPRDIAAATELVDFSLDRDNASATYRKLHRDWMIHDEIRFQRFERECREAKAAREGERRQVRRAA